jgi:hypothetical protein
MSSELLQYGIHSIKNLNSFVNSPSSIGIKDLKKEKIGVKKSFQIGLNYDTGILTVNVIIEFICKIDLPDPLRLFGATVQCDYKLINYESILKRDEKGKVDFPDDLMITLLSVSFSSSRGILASLTTGTDYSDYYLPLIDITEFKKMLKQINTTT